MASSGEHPGAAHGSRTPADERAATASPSRDGVVELWESFERLRRLEPGALAILDAADGTKLDRDGLARLVDRAEGVVARSELVSPAWRSELSPKASPASVPNASARGLALRVPNGAALVAAILACWRGGIAPFPLDAEMPDVEVDRHLRRIGFSGVLCGDGLRPRRLDGARPSGDVDAAGDDFSRSAPPAGTALLRMTSGTTAEPRAVAVSAAVLLADVEQIVLTMGIHERDRNLVAVPLSHCYGFDNVVLTLATLGCPAIVVRDLTPRNLLRAARRGGASILPAVPFLVDLLARAPVGGSPAWPELRLVISAGAMLPVEARERFAARFGVRPRVLYGSTECGAVSFDRAGAADLPEGCVGHAVDGVEIELADVVDGAGRLRVRSRAVATAYVPETGKSDQRVADRATLAAGVFLTPDLARFDERGRVVLLGRTSDVINVGGRKVFPAEVEAVIRRVPGVQDVAVVGAARSATSEAVRAVVIAEGGPRGGLDRAAIVAACTAELASYKVPRLVDFVSELPRNRRGKVDRRALAALGAVFACSSGPGAGSR